MAVTISVIYLAEVESVCIIDQMTGDRTRMLAESLQIEIENAELFGLPAQGLELPDRVALHQ